MTIDEWLVSPTFYGEGDFRGLFARLRREDPVHWTAQNGGRGFWSLFRHVDVSRVLDDPAGFSSEREGIMPLLDPEQEEAAKSAYGLGEGVVVIDPPRHAAYRKAISAPFVPKALREAEESTRRIIAEIFDAIPEHGEIDLVEDLGAKIPMAVICDVLSVPRADWHQLLRWGRMAVGGNDPEFRHGLTAGEAIAQGFGSIGEYTGALAESRRGCPHSEPLTSLANVEIGGRRLSSSEIRHNAGTLILGGFETTRNAFAGGVLALLENPRQMEILRGDPSTIRHAVEEVVRWSDPVLSLMRVATREVEIGGQTIREGDRVVTWLVGQSRRGGVRSPRRVRRHAASEPARVLRRRAALLSRRAAGADRAPRLARRADPPLRRHRDHRPGRAHPDDVHRRPEAHAGQADQAGGPSGLALGQDGRRSFRTPGITSRADSAFERVWRRTSARSSG